MPRELREERTPADLLEAAEASLALGPEREETIRECEAALARILAYMVGSGPTRLSVIGMRALVVARKLRPELVEGITFEAIAEQAGFGRSAAHKLSREFEDCFAGFTGPHDKSPAARQRLSRAWHAKHQKRSHPTP